MRLGVRYILYEHVMIITEIKILSKTWQSK